MEKERQSGEFTEKVASPILPLVNPVLEDKPETKKPESSKGSIPAAVYIATWIALSSSVIIFNKYILDTANFRYPIVLTTWHLGFATLMTQLMARFTTKLDSRKTVPMTGRIYLRAIVPIGIMFSLSLICGNLAYLYLSVSFIQMLKATTPVAVLLASWAMGISPANFRTLGNVALIVIGVVIASFGEIKFQLAGFLFQVGGIIFEALRLTMMQRLLSSAEFKMDPLVSLYYFAPACTIMNGLLALFVEIPKITMLDIEKVGYFTLLANAAVAFMLNVAVVFLIGRTSSLVLALSGVLKDILLVGASMAIFRDPVSGVQFFGYSVALAGLIYYKMGAEKLKEYLDEYSRQWADYGNRSPLMRKVLTIVLVAVTFIMLLGGLAGLFPDYDPTDYARQLTGMLGN